MKTPHLHVHVHVHVHVERYSFVQTNGDIEEYVVFILSNNGTSPLSLSGIYLKHDFTDSTDTAISAFDGLDAYDGCEFAHIGSIFRVGLALRGEIPPQGIRIIGAQVLRRNLADAQPDESCITDPLTVRELSAFPRATLEATVVYAFPPDDLRREIIASNTKFKTTRLVHWDYTPHPNALMRWKAKAVDAALPPATFEIDDLITDLYRIVASDASGAFDTSETLRLEALRIAERLNFTADSITQAKQLLATYWAQRFEERQAHTRRLIPTLHALRERVSTTPESKDTNHLDLLRLTIQNVRNTTKEYKISLPPPRNFTAVVGHLLRFADACRQGDPFEKNVREQGLQRRLRTFLQGASGPVESEVTMGRGRIDLLLGNTPIELKARKLGKNPQRIARKHFQQAADYAAGRRVASGILVILDTTDRSREKRHGAPLSHHIDVFPVPSRAALGGRAYTALIVLVIEAFPPESSALS